MSKDGLRGGQGGESGQSGQPGESDPPQYYAGKGGDGGKSLGSGQGGKGGAGGNIFSGSTDPTVPGQVVLVDVNALTSLLACIRAANYDNLRWQATLEQLAFEVELSLRR